MRGQDALFSSERDNWETPHEVFEAEDLYWGFTLDGAADSSNRKVGRYLGPGSDIAEDALSYEPDPSEIIWLNPPYSKVGEFMRWALGCSRRGCTVVCLVPARTDTRWFHDCVYTEVDDFRFIRGRLKFLENGQPSKNSAPFPSMLVYYGRRRS